MKSDVSFERRLRYQDKAIARLMCETRLLRDENAQLLAQLEAARQSGPAAAKGDRLEATLPAGPGGPATARAALTRWLTGQVPGEVLADARLLASELVANSGGIEPPDEGGAAVRGRAARRRVARRPARPEPVTGSGLETWRRRLRPAARRGARPPLGDRRHRRDPPVVRGRHGGCGGRSGSARRRRLGGRRRPRARQRVRGKGRPAPAARGGDRRRALPVWPAPGPRSSRGTGPRSRRSPPAHRPLAARSPTGRRRRQSGRSSATRSCRSSASPRSCSARRRAGRRRRPPSRAGPTPRR